MGVIVFLCIASVPVIAATLRLIVVAVALNSFNTSPTLPQQQKFNDTLYLSSQIEIASAFFAACLPAMRVFFRQKRERRRSSKELRVANSTPSSSMRSRGLDPEFLMDEEEYAGGKVSEAECEMELVDNHTGLLPA